MNRLERIFICMFGIVIVSIFLGGILYCAFQMRDATEIKEVLFWSSIILLFVLQVNRGFSSIIDIFFRKPKQRRKKK